MIAFFNNKAGHGFFYAVDFTEPPDNETYNRVSWLFDGAALLDAETVKGFFVGPRKEMITPWSTNAVEITQNMGIIGINRIELFRKVSSEKAGFDPMLENLYDSLSQDVFTINKKPDPIVAIHDISAYNESEGLALSNDEIEYLNKVSKKLGRPLTDSEVFGFSQVNSEHCRHKIFNGKFIIDGVEQTESLFELIKKTSFTHRNRLVSAYKDNCAFVGGPQIEQFAPVSQDKADFFRITDIRSVLSLKAETHNFPTTVEPFNGAATGSGGEIRDRLAGGKGSLPLAGTAVYMTSYPRLEASRKWEQHTTPRKWLYQTPADILVKASNGASDFGNKYGQPLICGSLLTFEYAGDDKLYGYDKVIMLAGGIGYANQSDSEKGMPQKGDKIIVLGGDNYRIGMGGGAVSSVATGEYDNTIELNAVQRSNPEMQKRVANAIRALAELTENPIVSIHDHGAGGHLNSLSELVESTGGRIDLEKLPVGDPTLSAKEIIGNESQERMGLILKEEDVTLLQKIALRERAPMYVVGEVTGDMRFEITHSSTGESPLNLGLDDMFGKPPRTVLNDETINAPFPEISYDPENLISYLEDVLQLEAVACKDWLTNKVDRSVTGKVALQQTAGTIQLPVNNLGAVALDYQGVKGSATSIGHAPVAGLVDPGKGSVLAVAEALTNLVWAPIEEGIKGVSLSANWMWPAKNSGENSRLYQAVEAISEFAIALGVNIPTGKDSLSMVQKYPDKQTVFSPGTVIVSTVGEVKDIGKIVTPVLKNRDSKLIYIDFSSTDLCLGGSSLSQIIGTPGTQAPTVADADYFARAFEVIQSLILENKILAGHDISSGGMITALLEMLFPVQDLGLDIDVSDIHPYDPIRLLFSENPGVIIQVEHPEEIEELFREKNLHYQIIGSLVQSRTFALHTTSGHYRLDIDSLRDLWFKTSYLLDRDQSGHELALKRYKNYKNQPLSFKFNHNFTGVPDHLGIEMSRRNPSGIKAAIIREKGVNGDREMAYSMHLAGFDVKDVHMTDLISGNEKLEDIHFIVFVGGFSNSDVLGSAKGWAGAFIYNKKANETLKRFYKRDDTLSLGICNGCQLMVELDLLYPEHEQKPQMLNNASGKFESAFLNVDIKSNESVMLGNMEGERLGIWVAHGEGRFSFPGKEQDYHIPVTYSYGDYPGNPNGSDYNAAAICSPDGRHLAMMPHLERAIFPWQWAHYPESGQSHKVSPWIKAFVNAREWIKLNKK